jgi:hypothetical protein
MRLTSLLRSVTNCWTPQRAKPMGRPSRRKRTPGLRPRLELQFLEDRTLLAAYLVTTSLDNGDNSNPTPARCAMRLFTSTRTSTRTERPG